ncbi:MAG: helix-turn-helix transcriptional regulator [Rhodobacteraceae bacterium]|nr:helix-turn-helix transcriptional regulator [Paracoccaceae bacterium]
MRAKSLEEYLHCPFHLAMNILEGKWKFAILYVLSARGTLRFKELERAIPEISTRMLTKDLKHLEEKGIVLRKAYATIPPKVEYSLTDIGHSIAPVISSITKWGEAYIEESKVLSR